MSDTTVARREFIRTVGAATAATALSYSRILGANERVQMGLIGCGGRGIGNMGNFLKLGSVDFVALCDVWGTAIDRARKAVPNAKGFGDYRAMLDLKELDAVMVATPDHWHLAQTVDAMNAGKDVYVEKPLTLKNEEGPEIIKAARLNKRICQVGMQQRSGQHYIEAKEQYFDTGRLGRVTLARTWWHGNTFHLRRAPAELQTQPDDLDWVGFVGPLPWRDYDPQQFYNWRAYLDYGGGQITDLFTHWIDVVHMFMGQDIPLSAVASGGVYAYQDGRTAPDTIHVLLEYPGPFTATFEATLVPGISGAGIEFSGTEGRLTITRGGYEFFPVPVRSPGKPAGEPESTFVRATSSLDQDHMGDFIECMKSRKLPKGDVLIGHRSAQASHLGNIAYVERRRIAFDPIREQILP
jgi:predicted dehydrogenase